MTYIIMATDECGDEFRADSGGFVDSLSAAEAISGLRDRHPEARGFFVELLKDKDYFMREHMMRDLDDDHWGYEYD